MALFGDVPANQALIREIAINTALFRKGVTAPSDVIIGTTPEVPVLRFAATNEIVDIGIDMPANWDKGDVQMRLLCRLVSVQLNNDTCDFTCDYVATTLATGEGVEKAETTITGLFTAVTGRLAIGDMYELVLTLLAADGTNPLANAISIHGELHLTNITGVASVDVVGAKLRYTATY